LTIIQISSNISCLFQNLPVVTKQTQFSAAFLLRPIAKQKLLRSGHFAARPISRFNTAGAREP